MFIRRNIFVLFFIFNLSGITLLGFDDLENTDNHICLVNNLSSFPLVSFDDVKNGRQIYLLKTSNGYFCLPENEERTRLTETFELLNGAPLEISEEESNTILVNFCNIYGVTLVKTDYDDITNSIFTHDETIRKWERPDDTIEEWIFEEGFCCYMYLDFFLMKRFPQIFETLISATNQFKEFFEGRRCFGRCLEDCRFEIIARFIDLYMKETDSPMTGDVIVYFDHDTIPPNWANIQHVGIMHSINEVRSKWGFTLQDEICIHPPHIVLDGYGSFVKFYTCS